MPNNLVEPLKPAADKAKLRKAEKGASNREKGYQVEALVKAYLIKQGLKEVCSNYSCKVGEIDLILKHHNTLVFTEIRYRKNARFGSSIETVSMTKQKKIIATAEHFLQHHAWSKKLYCRFDVIGATPATQGEKHCYNGLKINWIKNAFET